jgi:chromosomal replication initiation ATPase DnaA
MVLCERCGEAIRHQKTIDAYALFSMMAREVDYPLGELKRRRQPYVCRLQNIMYAMRSRGCKFTAIGRAIGRDHSDVIYGVKQVLKRLAFNDPSTAQQLHVLRAVQIDSERCDPPSTPGSEASSPTDESVHDLIAR